MIKKLILLLLAALAVGMAVPSTRAEIQRRAVTPVMDATALRIAPGRLAAMADHPILGACKIRIKCNTTISLIYPSRGNEESRFHVKQNMAQQRGCW